MVLIYRNVLIKNKCYISAKNNRLYIKTENQNEASIFLEDISILILEDLKSTITINAINELVKHKVITYICNENHMPNSYILNYQNHYNQLNMINLQMNINIPLKKNLWKKIITRKILSQAETIKYKDALIANKLFNISKDIKSGDSTNRESVASKLYFSIFEKNFNRRSNNIINDCLNYGYSIIRGCIARELVSFGFIPCIGIHHHNALNNFNLADDLIEPLRCIVDNYVLENINDIKELKELDVSTKSNLINLLYYEITWNENTYALNYAIKLYVKSFKSALEKENVELLIIPKFSKNEVLE